MIPITSQSSGEWVRRREREREEAASWKRGRGREKKSKRGTSSAALVARGRGIINGGPVERDLDRKNVSLPRPRSTLLPLLPCPATSLDTMLTVVDTGCPRSERLVPVSRESARLGSMEIEYNAIIRTIVLHRRVGIDGKFKRCELRE